nr:aminotransferase class III-fold pyridoxal phosphate-dependent enzyme [Schaedlerella arabinosiphila]
MFFVDEAQTGIGRTVTLLCSEQYHILPNIITLQKVWAEGFQWVQSLWMKQ